MGGYGSRLPSVGPPVSKLLTNSNYGVTSGMRSRKGATTFPLAGVPSTAGKCFTLLLVTAWTIVDVVRPFDGARHSCVSGPL